MRPGVRGTASSPTGRLRVPHLRLCASTLGLRHRATLPRRALPCFGSPAAGPRDRLTAPVEQPPAPVRRRPRHNLVAHRVAFASLCIAYLCIRNMSLRQWQSRAPVTQPASCEGHRAQPDRRRNSPLPETACADPATRPLALPSLGREAKTKRGDMTAPPRAGAYKPRMIAATRNTGATIIRIENGRYAIWCRRSFPGT
jgi:hypothetical protein